MSKYDDCHRVDNRYTTAIGMSVWRFFNVGKYKNQKVKDVCYFNPFYVAWCLENWQGFNPTQKASIVAKYYALTKGLKGLADAGALHRLRGTGLTRQDLLNMYRKYETTFDEVTGLALKYTKGLLHASMIGGVTAYLVLDKKHKLDTLDDFWNKVSTSTLPLYTSGQDKQKVVTDLWNKYISSKENIRVNITSAIIFK